MITIPNTRLIKRIHSKGLLLTSQFHILNNHKITCLEDVDCWCIYLMGDDGEILKQNNSQLNAVVCA